MTASRTSGSYSAVMRDDCSAIGMKPVCDHPSYCKTDGASLYIGQSNHLAYPLHRRTASYNPSGFDKIQSHWDGLCSYTNHANGKAVCQQGNSDIAWQYPTHNPGFICGKAAVTGFRLN
jgi:hypothetical protein